MPSEDELSLPDCLKGGIVKSVALTLSLAGIVILGCAAPPPMSVARGATRRVGEIPRLNEIQESSVGDPVYQTFNYVEYEALEGVKLSEAATVDVMAATWSLPAGELLAPAQDLEAGKIYCTQGDALRVLKHEPRGRVCLADRNGNGRFDAWRSPEGPEARQKWGKLQPEVGYSAGEPLPIQGGPPAGSGFRYELLYQGVSGNVVRLLYREYIDDMMRPAFQQDLTYTLAEEGPTEVSFRGSRLRIHTANNNSIKYELLSGLEPK
jgi:hypothetical protein